MESLLTELMSRYQTVARRYVEVRVRDPEVAADLYQIVLGAILESGKTFTSFAHLRNYFFVALRNAAVDHLRSRHRHPAGAQLPQDGDCYRDDRIPTPETQLIAAEEVVEQRRRMGALGDALGELSADERDLLRWRFWEKKTFREIRDMTSKPISTLKSREDAVIEKLKKILGKTSPPS